MELLLIPFFFQRSNSKTWIQNQTLLFAHQRELFIPLSREQPKWLRLQCIFLEKLHDKDEIIWRKKNFIKDAVKNVCNDIQGSSDGLAYFLKIIDAILCYLEKKSIAVRQDGSDGGEDIWQYGDHGSDGDEDVCRIYFQWLEQLIKSLKDEFVSESHEILVKALLKFVHTDLTVRCYADEISLESLLDMQRLAMIMKILFEHAQGWYL